MLFKQIAGNETVYHFVAKCPVYQISEKRWGPLRLVPVDINIFSMEKIGNNCVGFKKKPVL